MKGGPKLHPIRWVNNYYGTQRIVIPGGGQCSPFGYVKIWYNDPKGRRVVDRALTVKRAKDMIRKRMPLRENAA